MTQKVSSLLSKTVFFLLGLNFLSLCFALYFDRPLFAENSIWLLSLLTKKHLSADHEFYRFFPMIWQIPSYLLLKIQGDSTALTKPIIFIFEFLTNFASVFGLCITGLILKKKKRLNLIYFPILNFALASQGIGSYGGSGTVEAIAFFWPLVMATILQDDKSNLDQLVIFFLTIALSFTYEVTAILIPFLILILILNLNINIISKSQKNRQIFLFSLSCLFFIFRILTAKQDDYVRYLYSVNFGTYGFTYFGFLLSLILFIYICLNIKKIKVINALEKVLLLLSAIITIDAIFKVSHLPIMFQYFYRTTIVFVTAALVFSFVFWLKYGKLTSEKATNFLKAICCFALVTSFFWDISATYTWSQGIQYIQKVASDENRKCIVVKADVNTAVMNSGFCYEFTPYISLLIQKTAKPNFLFFTPSPQHSDSSNSFTCEIDNTGKILVNETDKMNKVSHFYYNRPGFELVNYFDLSGLMTK